jgi:hypothetical protein
MSRSALRAVSLALAALFALQLGAALAGAAPCAVPCCPGMASAADPDAASDGRDAQPCRSLSPVSCCTASSAAPAPEASAPSPVGPGASASPLVPAFAPPTAPAQLARCVAAPPALRSTVLRL